MAQEAEQNLFISEEDVDALVALLDNYQGSRLKLEVVQQEGSSGVLEKKYHHGRCDVGSPWANGTCI